MKKILMTIITFLIICISIWFQVNFLNSIPLSGVIANIGIVLVAGLGLVSGKVIGGIVGGVYGLLIDISFGRSLGVYTALYMLAGIISGFLNSNFSKGNKISMVMIILICTVLFETMAYVVNIVLNGYEFNFKVIFTKLILESAYNMLLTIIFFKPIAFLGDLLNRCKNSYYLL